MAEQLFKKNCDRDISLYLFTSLASVMRDQKTWSEFNSTQANTNDRACRQKQNFSEETT